MERPWASFAEGEVSELLAEAAEAHALAQQLSKKWDCCQAIVDLERYAATLEAMAR